MRAISAALTPTMEQRQQLAHAVQSKALHALVVRGEVPAKLQVLRALGHALPLDLRQVGDHALRIPPQPAIRTTTLPMGPCASRPNASPTCSNGNTLSTTGCAPASAIRRTISVQAVRADSAV